MIQNNLRNIFDNYNRKLGKHKLSLYQLSQITDIPRTTLNRLMSDPNKSMNGKTLNNLLDFFGVSVDQMIIYRREPYRFQLMNANEISSQTLRKRVKNHLSHSVALRSVDYQQTIIFTPTVTIKPLKNSVIFKNTDSNSVNMAMNNLIFNIKYANVTKYPIYNAIQCANLLNTVDFPLQLAPTVINQLLIYVAYVAVLHSGMVTRNDDLKCRESGLVAKFNGFKPTTHNSHYFKLKPLKSSTIELNNHPDLYNQAYHKMLNTDGGYFSNPINYYRKHFGTFTQNGYKYHFKNFDLIDRTTVNFANN